jgi:hypothetical protein
MQSKVVDAAQVVLQLLQPAGSAFTAAHMNALKLRWAAKLVYRQALQQPKPSSYHYNVQCQQQHQLAHVNAPSSMTSQDACVVVY